MAEIVPYPSTTNNKALKWMVVSISKDDFKTKYSWDIVDSISKSIAKEIDKEIVESMKHG